MPSTTSTSSRSCPTWVTPRAFTNEDETNARDLASALCFHTSQHGIDHRSVSRPRTRQEIGFTSEQQIKAVATTGPRQLEQPLWIVIRIDADHPAQVAFEKW